MHPFKLVGLGGAFDHLHEGHKQLLQMAFRLGDQVAIGLSSEKLLQNKSYKEKIQSYEERSSHLKQYIEDTLHRNPQEYQILKLDDPFGPAITVDALEAHVSSEETYKGALMINELRIKNGLNPLVLVIIPLIMGNDGQKMSSTTIRASL